MASMLPVGDMIVSAADNLLLSAEALSPGGQARTPCEKDRIGRYTPWERSRPTLPSIVVVHLVIDIWNQEYGNRRRADRYVDLPAVPRVGEIIDVAHMLTLKVTAVRWAPPDQRPTLFLGRSDGTTSSVSDEDAPVLTMPERLVQDLRKAGWQLSDW